jgi:hypothetical protein
MSGGRDAVVVGVVGASVSYFPGAPYRALDGRARPELELHR